MDDKKYIETNRELWNKRTDYHLRSDFYDLNGFINGATSLKDIELKLLGDPKGKSILHLQCHFGQDTISLGRTDADVTGVDLSDKAIAEAVLLSEKTAIPATFICCDIYDLPQNLDRKFDIVFTSYGTIGWLPDLDKWAKIVSGSLKPGGRFVFAEFHPVVWMMDYNFEKIAYNYFNDGPIIETESGTYADKSAPIEQESVSWNHGIGEVLSSLINNGLEIVSFEEYDYSPYNCFKGMQEFEPGKWRVGALGNKIPLVYALSAKKP